MRPIPFVLLAVTALLFAPLVAAQDDDAGDDPGDGGDGHGRDRDERDPARPSGRGPDASHGRDGAEDQDDPRDERDRHARFDDDEHGFRTLPDAARDHRPEVSFEHGRAMARLVHDGILPFDVQVQRVIEYLDEDGDGAYDPAEPVLSRFELPGLPARIVASDDHTRTVHYALGEGSLGLVFHASGASDAAGAAAKFDIVIADFPFSHPDSRLAVATHVAGPPGMRFTHIDGLPALAGAGTGDVPYISWVENVTVDGTDHAVVASALVGVGDNADGGLVYWSYPQGALIVHDPLLGIASIPVPTLGDLVVFAGALGIGILVLAAGYALRRRHPM